MTLDHNLLFEDIVSDADSKDVNWFSGSIILANKPFPTYGMTGSYYLTNIDGSQSKAICWFRRSGKHIEDFFKFASSRKIANEIEIVLIAKNLERIETRWNQTLIDEFESYLPKSKKGKYKPWYIDDNNWLANTKIEIPTEKAIDVFAKTLPVRENFIDEAEFKNLSIREIAKLLSPYCTESENILWDVGCIFLQKNEDSKISVELIQYYFEDEEDRSRVNDSYEQTKSIHLTNRMQSIYNGLQQKTRSIDQTFEWDDVFITISRSEIVDVQFILNDEELSFNYK